MIQPIPTLPLATCSTPEMKDEMTLKPAQREEEGLSSIMIIRAITMVPMYWAVTGPSTSWCALLHPLARSPP